MSSNLISSDVREVRGVGLVSSFETALNWKCQKLLKKITKLNRHSKK